MKKVYLLLLATILTISAFAQNFEGKINYKNTYKSKSQQMTGEQLTGMMGEKTEYYIKDGNYKSVSNGTYVQWQVYVNKDNKLYTKMSSSEAALWNDGASNTEEIISAKVNKGVTEILGYKCDELILVCKSGTQKYYYSSKIAADPKLFANHKYGNWFDYLSKAHALPLKSIIENEQFVFESEATVVTSAKLDASFFALPAGTKTEKSPY